jgi:hypothetical protein
MACDLVNGLTEQCKTLIGGIDAVYFVNFGIESGDLTYDVTNTDVIDAVANVTSLYKYELKGTNSFDQVVNSSRENGTTYVEQTLKMQLKSREIAVMKSVKLLAFGRPHVIVKTRNGKYYLAGLERGMELTTANINSGVQMADFNGYDITMVGMEKLEANLIDVADDAALATAFGSATIVTS